VNIIENSLNGNEFNMKKSIADLVSRLTPDPWREENAFATDISAANAQILAAKDNTVEIARVLREWLQKFQPCLFGRLAAKMDLLSFCILTEDDLLQDDEHVQKKIQEARSMWTREAFRGKKSGFVILATSDALINAEPNRTLQEFSARLCSLYLLEEDIKSNSIYCDEVFLEKPDAARTTWKWLAGVNVFATSADKRWWQDHRIPGGLAFSINSVGHMVKSGMLAQIMAEMNRLLGGETEEVVTAKVDSLEKALELAMRTIALASDTVSGKATELLQLPADTSSLTVSKCPVKLPSFLADKNYCEYQGKYHTDVTIPADYFDPSVAMPTTVETQRLDFTYLFHKDVDNPAFDTMGSGRRIRDFRPSEVLKLSKGAGISSPIAENSRLREALRM
jgi:hypothetical protein